LAQKIGKRSLIYALPMTTNFLMAVKKSIAQDCRQRTFASE